MIKLLFKFGSTSKVKTSSPKILIKAPVFYGVRITPDKFESNKGHIFESIVGARLCNAFESVFYWREGQHEVDFVVVVDSEIFAIEVKLNKEKTRGIAVFKSNYPKARSITINSQNYEKFEFDPENFLRKYSI